MNGFTHGDFLSAWAEVVAERLARKAAEVLMKGGEQRLTFPQLVERMRQQFDMMMIAEGQALMRKSKARPTETGMIIKAIDQAPLAGRRDHGGAIVKRILEPDDTPAPIVDSEPVDSVD